MGGGRRETVRDPDKVTINDVAAKAEVSPAAVSQILNDKGNFPEKTRERVREAADDLGYRPSRAAASLRTGKTLTVGMVVSGSHDPLWSSQWVHVTARLLVDAAEELNRQGYSLLVLPSTGVELMNKDDIDAVIISDSMDDDPALEAALSARIPVLTNDRLDDNRIAVHVDSGYAEMTQFSFDLFQQRGRARPALLTEPSEFHTDSIPERLWRSLCEATGVEPLIEQVLYDRQNLETAVQSLLDQGADAIFSFAGEGIEVARIIESSGRALGSDMFLISCEMGPDFPTVEKGISTLEYRAERGALAGVPVLLDILGGSLSAPQTVSLGWEFYDQASTAVPTP
jgi:DNA-binding LacI/PurR family transcriptional regulator